MTDEIWTGRQWRVTADGLEDSDGFQPTWFAKHELAHPSPDVALPAHMACKPWVDFEDFIRAFLIACVVHKVDLPNVGSIIDHAVEMRKASGLPGGAA